MLGKALSIFAQGNLKGLWICLKKLLTSLEEWSGADIIICGGELIEIVQRKPYLKPYLKIF